MGVLHGLFLPPKEATNGTVRLYLYMVTTMFHVCGLQCLTEDVSDCLDEFIEF